MLFIILLLFQIITGHMKAHCEDNIEYANRFFPEIPKEQIAITPLLAGYSDAQNYLVNASGKPYVLRVFAETELPADLKRELHGMQVGAKLGIAPRVHHVSTDDRAILMDYIEGGTVTLAQIKQPENIVKIAKALRTVHATVQNPYPSASFNDKMEGYYQMLKEHSLINSAVTEAISRIRIIHEKLAQDVSQKVSTHGDLNPRNIFLTGEGIRLIDWAECNWEDPFYDLTCLTLMNDYSEKEEALLLESYFERLPTTKEKERYSLVKKARLAGSCLVSELLLSQMTQKDLDPAMPLKDWSHYIQLFASNQEKLPPQFFYDLSRLALQLSRDRNEIK